jgi:hypothetical protein
MQLVPVPTANVGQLRPIWEPWLARIKGISLQEMVAKVLSSEITLLIVWDEATDQAKGMAVAEFSFDENDRKWCTITYCAGDDVRLWHSQEPAFCRWAKEHMGCFGVKAIGRPGWKRLAEKYGYRLSKITIEKEL